MSAPGDLLYDSTFLDRRRTRILALEGDAHVEWFEGNFEDYEADKIRRLGPDAVEPKRIKYKKFARYSNTILFFLVYFF